MTMKTIWYVLVLFTINTAAVGDSRQQVEIPEQMREHMLSNMRNHLLALEAITRKLANEQYDEAAEVAENRLGMSSMESHGASHIAQYMPEGMRASGTAMHHAASRFSIAAQNAAVDGGLNTAFAALSEVMAQCVACHTAYRVH